MTFCLRAIFFSKKSFESKKKKGKAKKKKPVSADQVTIGIGEAERIEVLYSSS